MHRIVSKGFQRKSVSICSGVKETERRASQGEDTIDIKGIEAKKVLMIKALSMGDALGKKVTPKMLRQETFKDFSQSASNSPFNDSFVCSNCNTNLSPASDGKAGDAIPRCGHKTNLCPTCCTHFATTFCCFVCLGNYCTAKCKCTNSACTHPTCARCSYSCRLCSERSCVTCLTRCTECLASVCGRCVNPCFGCGQKVCSECRTKNHGTKDEKFLCESCLTNMPNAVGCKWVKIQGSKIGKTLYACEDALAFTEEGRFAGSLALVYNSIVGST